MLTRDIPYKNILVTGGAGFIGSATVLELLKLGINVRVVDSLLPQIHGVDKHSSPTYSLIKNDVHFIEGDVRDSALWEKAIDGQDAILHLAALTGTGQSMYNIEDYIDVNIGGTSKMLQAILDKKNCTVKHVVVAGSRSIYGEGKYINAEKGNIEYPGARQESNLDNGVFDILELSSGAKLESIATDENSKLSPESIYAITKLNQEQVIHNLCGALGIGSISLRYQNVFGAGQSLNNPYTGILSVFTRAIHENKKINVFEDGLSARDFIYISDVVEANLAALGVSGYIKENINIGTGKPITVLSAMQTLSKYLNKTADYSISGDYRLGDIRCCYADTLLAENKINFKAKVNFEDGCKRFVDWISEFGITGVATASYDKSISEMKSLGLMKSGNYKD